MTQRIKVSYKVEDMRITFQVLEDKEVIESMRVSFDRIPEEGDIRDRITLYGLNKLLTDRTSAQKDKLEKLEAMDTVMDLLASGEWAKERAIGAVMVSVEVEALAQLKELSVPATQKALAEYDKETRKKILASKVVQELAAEIRETRASTEIMSLDDMIPEDTE